MYSARKNKELLIQVQRLREIDLCCILLRETSKQTHFFLRKYLRIILKSKIQHTQTPLETSRRDNYRPQEKENYR
jgi:hypothetical protein